MEEQEDSAAGPVLPGGSKDSSGLWCHEGHVEGLLFKASESRVSLLKALKEQSRGAHGRALRLTPLLLLALLGSRQEIKEPGAVSVLLAVNRQRRHSTALLVCGINQHLLCLGR